LEAAGVVHEVEDPDERLEAIASQHLAAVREGASSLIVAPTHAECRAIAARVREFQKAVCLLSPEEHQLLRLERLNLTESQRHDFYQLPRRPGRGVSPTRSRRFQEWREVGSAQF
jgi:hypothetical protein